MTLRIAVNGLGRIGRQVLRVVAEQKREDVVIVAANGPADTATHRHLIQYDSVQGTFPHPIKHDEENDTLDMGMGAFQILHERDPLKLPWKKLGVDVVVECTGMMNHREGSARHLEAGAKKVLISAPAKEVDATVVYGVNHAVIKPEHTVLSVGSCTTNCLAPIAKVLHDLVGIEQGFMTTIHAYTGDQRILDGSHKDLRRARAAAMSMIPTSTGAAKAIGLVLPELEGRISGTAIRVPTPNVSMVDLTFNAKNATSIDEIHAAMREASEGAMKGVLGYCDEPLVSIDFNHSAFSSIYDASGTYVTDGNFVRVAAWYDNEWGFSCRMIDVAALLKGML